jgi:hypothetical protein
VGELERKTPVDVLQGRTWGGGSGHRCIAAAEGFKLTLAYASTCASSNAAGGEWRVTGDSGNMLGGGVSTEDRIDGASVEWILEFGRANEHWALMKVAPRGAIRTCLGFKGGKTQCVRGAEGSAQAQPRCASHDGAHRIACGRSQAGQTAIRVIKDNNIDEATIAEFLKTRPWPLHDARTCEQFYMDLSISKHAEWIVNTEKACKQRCCKCA